MAPYYLTLIQVMPFTNSKAMGNSNLNVNIAAFFVCLFLTMYMVMKVYVYSQFCFYQWIVFVNEKFKPGLFH